MEVNTTRDIARQILRHRSFSFQEFSQRYADPTKDLGFSTREARLQDGKNRQNSLDVEDDDLHAKWRKRQQYVIDFAADQYAWAVKHGIAKEIARAVLPEGLTNSRLYMAGTLRSWIHYVRLRTDAATQKEHREVAQKIGEELLRAFPSLSEVFPS
jgi:thymidylate synthase (FAD)